MSLFRQNSKPSSIKGPGGCPTAQADRAPHWISQAKTVLHDRCETTVKSYQKHLIAGVLIFLSVSGCSDRAPEETGRTTVTFWHSFVASTIPALDSLLVEFHGRYPEIRVNAQYVPTGDGLIQKLAGKHSKWYRARYLLDTFGFLGQACGGGRHIPNAAIYYRRRRSLRVRNG